jgi:biotin/methionine sulfoxide reductase
LPGPEVSTPPNPARSAIPVARIADMLLAPNGAYEFNGRREIYPDIRLVYWAGGNPFHHHQDLNRLRKAWQKPDTIIVHDSWWTPTARHADIVLPATTSLERNDVGGSSRDPYVFAMHRAIAPLGDAKHDFEIFRDLAGRLGYEDAFTEGRDEMAWCRWIYERVRTGSAKKNVALPDFDTFWADGFVELPPPDEDFVLFDDFRRDPQLHPLKTPSGKIEIASQTIAGFGYADCPPHPAWLPPAEWLGSSTAERWPLHLITHQPAGRLHSQLDPASVSRGHKLHGRERIRLHPQDADPRGIKTGDVVRVFNDRGACLAAAQVDAAMLPRVAIMATGAWFDPALAAGEPERHGNPNVLTLDIGTSRLAQGPSALSALIEIERWDALPPPVEAWSPPRLATIATDNRN